MKKKVIYLPVEIKAREFHSRLLVASYAAAKGYAVVFGKKSEVVKAMAVLPSGVVIDKSITSYAETHLQEIVSYGHLLCSIDEEGIVYRNEEFYANSRFSSLTLSISAKVFTWGKVQTATIKKYYPDYQHKLIATGNPRVDIWYRNFHKIYQDEADRLVEQHGDFILVPSNFALYINANGSQSVYNQVKSLKLPITIEERKREVRFMGNVFIAFVQAIFKLSEAHPGRKIIIRPHPADDHSIWKTLFHPFENVEVIYEGSIEPFLLAAKVVIHNGCTTGIQSALMGKPTIAYQPVVSEEFDLYLANSVSNQVYSENELLKLTTAYLSNTSTFKVDPSAMNSLSDVMHLQCADPAYVNMVTAIDQLEVATASVSASAFKTALVGVPKKKSPNFKKAIRQKIKSWLKIVDPQVMTQQYRKQKYPGDSVEEVIDVIAKLGTIDSNIRPVTVAELSEHLYLITD